MQLRQKDSTLVSYKAWDKADFIQAKKDLAKFEKEYKPLIKLFFGNSMRLYFSIKGDRYAYLGTQASYDKHMDDEVLANKYDYMDIIPEPKDSRFGGKIYGDLENKLSILSSLNHAHKELKGRVKFDWKDLGNWIDYCLSVPRLKKAVKIDNAWQQKFWIDTIKKDH